MKALIIGNFGYKTNNIGGQTIKTRNLLELYANKLGESNVSYFDLDSLSIFSLVGLLINIISTDKLIIVPGQKFLKHLFNPLLFLAKLLHKKVVFFAVGGWLYDFLSEQPKVLALILRCDIVYVESKKLKEDLKKLYLFNVKVFPNFRFHQHKVDLKASNSSFKIVFMARITETKGCEYLFRFLEQFNNEYPKNHLEVNFYGPMDTTYENNFIGKINSFENAKYFGSCQPEEVFSILSNHDLCILPTFYEGEGFPGTIIDSYISGIPIIISNWKNLPEFVDNGKTGFIFNLNDELELYNYIVRLYKEEDLLLKMKKFALDKSKEYSAEEAWKIINS